MNLCDSDEEEDHRLKAERGHENLEDEDGSVIELEYAVSSRGKSPTSTEGSPNVKDVPVLVKEVSDCRCDFPSDVPVI